MHEHQRQHIEEHLDEALADQHEQFRNKNGLLRKSGKASRYCKAKPLAKSLMGLALNERDTSKWRPRHLPATTVKSYSVAMP